MPSFLTYSTFFGDKEWEVQLSVLLNFSNLFISLEEGFIMTAVYIPRW